VPSHRFGGRLGVVLVTPELLACSRVEADGELAALVPGKHVELVAHQGGRGIAAADGGLPFLGQFRGPGFGGGEPVGFAIPVAIVKRVVPELIKGSQYKYAYLGLQGSTITPELATALGLETNKLGAYVTSVIPGSPAEKGGVKGGSETVTTPDGAELQKGGDIITAIEDQPVHSMEDLLTYMVTKATPGQTVSLTVLRDGAEQKLNVTLGERPAQAPTASAQPDKSGKINARAAISIAEGAAKDKGLTGDITEKVATPDQADGKDVWVVELSTANQTATVTVDAVTGDVVSVDVK